MALNYGSSTSLACTSFNSLANSTTALASSAAATTTTSNNIVDAMVQVKVNAGANTPSASTIVSVFAYGSLDGTTGSYSGAVGGANELIDGSDKAITVNAYGHNLRFLGTILIHTASVVYQSEPMSIAAAFGGIMPRKWGVVLMNQSGVALAASGHDVRYSEIYYN